MAILDYLKTLKANLLHDDIEPDYDDPWDEDMFDDDDEYGFFSYNDDWDSN